MSNTLREEITRCVLSYYDNDASRDKAVDGLVELLVNENKHQSAAIDELESTIKTNLAHMELLANQLSVKKKTIQELRTILKEFIDDETLEKIKPLLLTKLKP